MKCEPGKAKKMTFETSKDGTEILTPTIYGVSDIRSNSVVIEVLSIDYL